MYPSIPEEHVSKAKSYASLPSRRKPAAKYLGSVPKLLTSGTGSVKERGIKWHWPIQNNLYTPPVTSHPLFNRQMDNGTLSESPEISSLGSASPTPSDSNSKMLFYSSEKTKPQSGLTVSALQHHTIPDIIVSSEDHMHNPYMQYHTSVDDTSYQHFTADKSWVHHVNPQPKSAQINHQSLYNRPYSYLYNEGSAIRRVPFPTIHEVPSNLNSPTNSLSSQSSIQSKSSIGFTPFWSTKPVQIRTTVDLHWPGPQEQNSDSETEIMCNFPPHPTPNKQQELGSMRSLPPLSSTNVNHSTQQELNVQPANSTETQTKTLTSNETPDQMPIIGNNIHPYTSALKRTQPISQNITQSQMNTPTLNKTQPGVPTLNHASVQPNVPTLNQYIPTLNQVQSNLSSLKHTQSNVPTLKQTQVNIPNKEQTQLNGPTLKQLPTKLNTKEEIDVVNKLIESKFKTLQPRSENEIQMNNNDIIPVKIPFKKQNEIPDVPSQDDIFNDKGHSNKSSNDNKESPKAIFQVQLVKKPLWTSVKDHQLHVRGEGDHIQDKDQTDHAQEKDQRDQLQQRDQRDHTQEKVQTENIQEKDKIQDRKYHKQENDIEAKLSDAKFFRSYKKALPYDLKRDPETNNMKIPPYDIGVAANDVKDHDMKSHEDDRKVAKWPPELKDVGTDLNNTTDKKSLVHSLSLKFQKSIEKPEKAEQDTGIGNLRNTFERLSSKSSDTRNKTLPNLKKIGQNKNSMGSAEENGSGFIDSPITLIL
ncbi:unnamed protein product [Owenia fusiformis]|uniref:Uncharacterized protein n=1 Tax=Owenia fusiformis TaxID=6347 RepID=A0A8S4Q1M0_OWEFU|nr:unnamed protein product [Owenia fusiformis]